MPCCTLHQTQTVIARNLPCFVSQVDLGASNSFNSGFALLDPSPAADFAALAVPRGPLRFLPLLDFPAI